MTRRVSIQTALVVSHLLVLALPVAVVLGTDALSRDLVHTRQVELERQGALVALLLDRGSLHDIPPKTLATLRSITHAGVRVIDADGVVVATSGPRLGADLSDHAEVAAALAGDRGVAVRTEVPPALSLPRLDRRKEGALTLAFAAVPLRIGGQRVGAVLLTRPTREVWGLLEDLAGGLGPGAALAAGLTLGLALWSGWRISRSLRALARIADRIAEGRGPDDALHALAGTRVVEVALLARAFEAMTVRMQARLRYNREFASNVSHEFKTPLTTLSGTVELLAEDGGMPPDQRARFLANARTDIDRLHRLTAGLLQLAHAEEGSRSSTTDLDALAAVVATRHPHVLLDGDAGSAPGDAAQIEAALENLLLNAREHGGPNVRMRAWREDGRAGFDVEDDGPGISPANLPQVFDRFFTTGRDRRGTGLGLPLVRTIARAHGGDVTVESAPGRTRFRMWVAI